MQIEEGGASSGASKSVGSRECWTTHDLDLQECRVTHLLRLGMQNVNCNFPYTSPIHLNKSKGPCLVAQELVQQ